MKKPLLISSVLLVAGLLRVPLLNGSFWLDEAAQALESVRPLFQQLQIVQDFQPPLYHLWLHLFTYISHTEWWLRISSLIPGIITIYVTYLLGQAITNRKAGLIAASLLATSQFHIFYSQELRPYSFAAMWGIMATFYWFRLVHGQRDRSAIKYALSSLAGLYSVYTFAFLLIAQAITTYFFFRKQVIPVLKTQLIMFISFLPLVPLIYRQLQTGLALNLQVPGWSNAVSFPSLKAVPLTLIKLFIGRLDIDFSWLTITLTITGLIVWLSVLWLVHKTQVSKILLTLIVIVLLTTYLIHLFIPILEPKRFLYLLPLLYLSITTANSHRFGRFLCTGLLVINLMSYGIYLITPRFHREPWRQAIQEITAVAPPQSAVIFAFSAPFAPWNWYQPSYPPAFTTGTTRVTSSTPLDVRFEPLLLADHLFVFTYLMDLTDPERYTLNWLQTHGFRETGFLQYPNLGKIYILESQNIYAQGSGYSEFTGFKSTSN